MEKGTTNGAITDLDGNATVKLSGKNNHLVISYVGMKTKTIDVKGKKEIKVVMEDDNTTLNDVVVIGYGTVKKKDLTGSVSSINQKQIANIPVSNVSEAMTGKMAGVNITTTEGSPDADVKIFLTASPEARADRRFRELQEKGTATTYDAVLADMKQRDYDDENRAVSPLRRAADAVLVDTSHDTLEQSVARLRALVTARLPRAE